MDLQRSAADGGTVGSASSASIRTTVGASATGAGCRGNGGSAGRSPRRPLEANRGVTRAMRAVAAYPLILGAYPRDAGAGRCAVETAILAACLTRPFLR